MSSNSLVATEKRLFLCNYSIQCRQQIEGQVNLSSVQRIYCLSMKLKCQTGCPQIQRVSFSQQILFLHQLRNYNKYTCNISKTSLLLRKQQPFTGGIYGNYHFRNNVRRPHQQNLAIMSDSGWSGFKMRRPSCFLQMWFLFASPPTVQFSSDQLPVYR